MQNTMVRWGELKIKKICKRMEREGNCTMNRAKSDKTHLTGILKNSDSQFPR